MKDFVKIMRTHDRVWIKAEYKGGRLSITGVDSPTPRGSALACGQICLRFDMSDVREFAPGWDRESLQELLDLWGKWHLNDMQAGSPAQMDELEKHEFPGFPANHYDWALNILNDAGLNPDPDCLHEGEPYHYGSAWLTVEVPDDVLEKLQSFPDADKTPIWI